MLLAFVGNSFAVPDFTPPWWARNAHFQTIAGALWGRAPTGFQYTHRARLCTPDNDWFDVDCAVHSSVAATKAQGAQHMEGLPTVSTDRPLAVILHGLESSARSTQSLRLANLFYRFLGADVYAMNFRGCSGEPNATAKSYHLGETSDLKLLIEQLRQESIDLGPRDRARPLFLSGFSLGGNVICKYLGESAEHAQRHQVTSAAVYCVPFDALASQPILDSGLIRRYVYSRRFVRSIQRKLRQRQLSEPLPYDLQRVMKATTIGEIDDAYIAPTYGFQDRFDYYRKCSCGPFLPQVRTPLLIINARDDPFMAPDSLLDAERVRNPFVCLAYTTHGGHCGFFSGADSKQGEFWIGEQFRRFFEQFLAPVSNHSTSAMQ
jgi:predicted alpha/beta-fold hydrolase